MLELPPPPPPPLAVELDALWLLFAVPLGWGVDVPEREDMVVEVEVWGLLWSRGGEVLCFESGWTGVGPRVVLKDNESVVGDDC